MQAVDFDGDTVVLAAGDLQITVTDDIPLINGIQNAVMPSVNNTDAHGTWLPAFGADGPNATAAIGIAMGTAPGGETYSIVNNVGTSTTGEHINAVTVGGGTAYTFYEYTHYDAATHSAEMFAYQTLADAQAGLGNNEFFTLTMSANGTYDFNLVSNNLQTSVSISTANGVVPNNEAWVAYSAGVWSADKNLNTLPNQGYDVLIQAGSNYSTADGSFKSDTVNSNIHGFGGHNPSFDNAEVVDFKFGSATDQASFGVYNASAGDSFQIQIWDSTHTHSLIETVTGNLATVYVDAAHWQGTGINNDLAAFQNFISQYGGFTEMDVVNTGASVEITSIGFKEVVTVGNTTLTFAPTITDGDGDTASSAANLTVTLDGSHTGSGYQLTGTNDVFVASANGHDTFTGNGTNDTVDFSNASGAVQANLATHIYGGAANGDTLTGIENLIGSSYADTLTAATTGSVLDGGANSTGGTDALNGGAGNDTLIASRAGTDSLTGGGGIDTFVLHGDGLANVTITDFNASDSIVVDVADLNLTISNAALIDTAAQFNSGGAAPTNGGAAWSESTSGDKFYYDTTNQDIWYSASGTGNDQVKLAHLGTGVAAADVGHAIHVA